MKKTITLMLLGFVLAFGVAVTVIAPAAWAIGNAVEDAAALQATTIQQQGSQLTAMRGACGGWGALRTELYHCG